MNYRTFIFMVCGLGVLLPSHWLFAVEEENGSKAIVRLGEIVAEDEAWALAFESKLVEAFTENERVALSLESEEAIWELRGEVLQWKKGNRGLRLKVGYGAGEARLKVRLKVVALSSGDVIESFVVRERYSRQKPASEVTGTLENLSAKAAKDVANRVVQLLEEQL